MGSATSVAARPRFTAFGASFTPRLDFPLALPLARGAAFFRVAMISALRFGADDDAGAAAVGEIRPRPVDEHDEPAAEPDQEIDVEDEPEPPGDRSGKCELR